MIDPVFKIVGDRGLLVELGTRIDLKINQQVRSLLLALQRLQLNGVLEILPAYSSLLIVFDPLRLSLSILKAQVRTIISRIDSIELPASRTIKVPVVYGGDHGPDLEWVARYHHLEPDEVVRAHAATEFHVYMIGFTPGFPYMGELPRAIVTPRRETPRTHVPGGSVGIAQNQTGIYPVESPGGWQIIGRTPLTLFDPDASPPARFEIGDRVVFQPISPQEYETWPA